MGASSGPNTGLGPNISTSNAPTGQKPGPQPSTNQLGNNGIGPFTQGQQGTLTPPIQGKNNDNSFMDNSNLNLLDVSRNNQSQMPVYDYGGRFNNSSFKA